MKLPGLVQFRLCKLDNEELANRVADGLNKMYETGRIPDRFIPARPDEDFDLLLAELIVRFKKLNERKEKTKGFQERLDASLAEQKRVRQKTPPKPNPKPNY